jgi:DNA (cytosine-5)-methyltransferase 1
MTSDATSPSPPPARSREVGTSIELFTGGGGLALAMHGAGFRHLLAVELDKRACATLRANVAEPFDPDAEQAADLDSKWPLIGGDIHTVDFTRWLGQVDVVAGGVPCQPWSLGGVHKGVRDPRNLWPELFRVVRETRPRAIIAENVKGLLRPSFSPYYEYILNELRAPFEKRVEGEDWRDHDKRIRKALAKDAIDPTERYDVKHMVVNAADYGVPQVRWRVFVVGFRRDLGLEDWDFPTATHSEAALLRSQADGTYWDRHKIAKRWRYAPEVPPDSQDGKDQDDKKKPKQPWRTLRDALTQSPALGEPVGDKVEHPKHLHHYGWPGAREYPGHTPNELDRPAKTVKAGVHGVPGGETVLRRMDGSIRYMTVREVARVMTFPDYWRLVGPRGEQMRQLGNAVPVMLGQVIADSVAETLRPFRAPSSEP